MWSTYGANAERLRFLPLAVSVAMLAAIDLYRCVNFLAVCEACDPGGDHGDAESEFALVLAL